MTYTKLLTVAQEGILNAKVALVSTPTVPITLSDLLNWVIDRYIQDCGRDVGMDLDMKVQNKFNRMTEVEKKAFIA